MGIFHGNLTEAHRLAEKKDYYRAERVISQLIQNEHGTHSEFHKLKEVIVAYEECLLKIDQDLKNAKQHMNHDIRVAEQAGEAAIEHMNRAKSMLESMKQHSKHIFDRSRSDE